MPSIQSKDVVEINTCEKRRTVTIPGADGTRIVHSTQLPDRRRLLMELRNRCGETLPRFSPESPLEAASRSFNSYGIFVLMLKILNRVSLRLQRWYNFRVIASSVAGKKGLEIGGPSQVFSEDGLIPIYPLLGSLQTLNYSQGNLWSENTFDYILDATRLESVENGQYDFLLASHVLEHVANPIKALKEWHRVLKPHGSLLVMLPDKNQTFDHRRPYTSFVHLREDFDRGTEENDLTHLDEILALHDLERDPPAGTLKEFKERSLHNFENRALHHHVFDPKLIPELFSFAGFKLLRESVEFPPHIIAFGRKTS